MTDSWGESLRKDVTGGLVSAAVAIPLALGFGMFVFVGGDDYFARGALAGLISAFVAGCVSIVALAIAAQWFSRRASRRRFSLAPCSIR